LLLHRDSKTKIWETLCHLLQKKKKPHNRKINNNHQNKKFNTSGSIPEGKKNEHVTDGDE